MFCGMSLPSLARNGKKWGKKENKRQHNKNIDIVEKQTFQAKKMGKESRKNKRNKEREDQEETCV